MKSTLVGQERVSEHPLNYAYECRTEIAQTQRGCMSERSKIRASMPNLEASNIAYMEL